MSWHSFVVGLLVVGAWSVYRGAVDQRLPTRVRRWIRVPFFDFYVFVGAMGVARVFTPSAPESALWVGLAAGAIWRIVQVAAFPPLPDLAEEEGHSRASRTPF